MGRRTSIYLTDEDDALLRKDGRTPVQVIRDALTPKPAAKTRAARATRIPDDFAVTPAMVAWFRENVPHVDGRLETEKFTNYWLAASGPNARKVDWVAAWRTWMLKASRDYPGGRLVKTREQEAHDQMFDRAAQRAQERMAARERAGSGEVGPLRPRALPSAED